MAKATVDRIPRQRQKCFQSQVTSIIQIRTVMVFYSYCRMQEPEKQMRKSTRMRTSEMWMGTSKVL
jgi:hypothetical protein